MISLLMPDSVSPTGIAADFGHFYTFNGESNRFYSFDASGRFESEYTTLRPYSGGSYSTEKSLFAGRITGNGGRIFICNENFEEIMSVPLEIQENDFSVNDCFFGGSGYIVTHKNSVCEYFPDGSYGKTVVRCRKSRNLLKYFALKENFAVYYIENGRHYLEYNNHGGEIPGNIKLKGFFEAENRIYGGFSVNYLYTYILPISEGEVINPRLFDNFAYMLI